MGSSMRRILHMIWTLSDNSNAGLSLLVLTLVALSVRTGRPVNYTICVYIYIFNPLPMWLNCKANFKEERDEPFSSPPFVPS